MCRVSFRRFFISASGAVERGRLLSSIFASSQSATLLSRSGGEMGPGPYSEIGKKARDHLCKDYQTDHKFTITTYTSNGIAITSWATKNNDLIFGEIQSQIKNKNITFDVKTNSNSNVTTTVTIEELATPGLKTILSFVGPDQKSGKVRNYLLCQYYTENLAEPQTGSLHSIFCIL